MSPTSPPLFPAYVPRAIGEKARYPPYAQGVNEFMFVLGQARVRGTVQMIINPVALWW